jgi:hypothetical protein
MALGPHLGGSGDFPEWTEPAVFGRDGLGKDRLGAPSPKKLPGPKLKAEIRAGRSQVLLRLVAASLPLPHEETRIQERPYLDLPFDGMPDLSAIRSRGACRNLLKSLDPELDPRTLDRKTDRLWHRCGNLSTADTIAVPLPSRNEVAMAEVTEPYRYESPAGQPGRHRVGVKWHTRTLRFSSLRNHQDVLTPNGERLVEIADSVLRRRLPEKQPHASNRFAKWKWLLTAIFVINLITMLSNLPHSLP